jgi:16S rRNA (guanine966-N2)-methyltransferase
MRVIAGTAKSLPLNAPKGMNTRPTTDRIKETLFNIIQPYLVDCIFVDVFSGSGGIGIEALSRGARRAYFIDSASASVLCIKNNLAFTNFSDRAIVIRQDACIGIQGIREEHVDIVFIDPPYGQGMEKKVMETLARLEYVTEDTLIVAESPLNTDFSYLPKLGLFVAREKKYKSNQHIFINKTIIGQETKGNP